MHAGVILALVEEKIQRKRKVRARKLSHPMTRADFVSIAKLLHEFQSEHL